MALNVGDRAPEFRLPSHLDRTIGLGDFRGQNVLLAFFPYAWTPVCTHQIPAYQADLARFQELDTQVLGISVDPVPTLKAWAEHLGGIDYPLLSDFWPHGAVASAYGVLRPEGHTERAIFIVDRDGVLRYVDVHEIDDQPDNEVVLAELRRIAGIAAPASAAPEMASSLPRGGVVMYCTAWCPDCKRAREWLDARRIAYRVVDIMATPGAADQVRQWTGGSLVTPTFDIDGQIVVDFDEAALRATLGLTE